jgi:hypothetical protein
VIGQVGEGDVEVLGVSGRLDRWGSRRTRLGWSSVVGDGASAGEREDARGELGAVVLHVATATMDNEMNSADLTRPARCYSQRIMWTN